MGSLLGSFRDWARTPEVWLYTVLACALIALFRCPPFRSVPRETNGGGVGPHMTVFKSAFLPCHRVKMDIPKPRGILKKPTSNERSRSPLSIGALRFARGDRKGVVTKVASKTCFIFTAQSRPLARLVQDDGSRKLPQTTRENTTSKRRKGAES